MGSKRTCHAAGCEETPAHYQWYCQFHRTRKQKVPRPWSPRWALVRGLYDGGLNDIAISIELGISRERVRQMRAGMGIPPQPRWRRCRHRGCDAIIEAVPGRGLIHRRCPDHRRTPRPTIVRADSHG